MRILLSLVLTVLLTSSALADPANVLEDYVKRPQPKYGWTVKKTEDMGGGTSLVRIDLISQEWKGYVWKHRLNLLVPPPAKGDRARPGHVLMGIGGSGGEKGYLQMLAPVARHLGVPVAILHDVPNQPLFKHVTPNGKGFREDALISYTFGQYAKTGDTDWPVLLPMTRSVVSAMDALREYSAKRLIDKTTAAWGHGRLTKVVTTGGSKRGWTTWLSAVADDRVIGIAPIVFDNLNFARQMALHLDVWGKPSPSIHDYTDRGLLPLLKTRRGQELLRIVDPFTYRARYDLPKMTCIGTNDNYWPLEAIHQYRGELPGNLYVHYVPNAGHSAGLSVVQALTGFFDHVTRRIPDLPTIDMSIHPGRTSALVSPLNPADRSRITGVNLWGTHVPGRDFTKARWQKVSAKSTTRGWSADLPKACVQDKGRSAFIGEIQLRDSGGGSFSIHTPVQVWELGPKQ